jgi:FkbM family methyltransferase
VSASRSSTLAAIRDHLGRELQFIFRGATVRDRIEIARMLLRLHTRIGRLRRVTARLTQPSEREFDLQLRDGPSLRLRSDDIVAVHIFAIGEYDVDLRPLGEVTSLLDLGANVGLASIALARRLGSVRTVACIEPAPDSFRLLEINLRRNLKAAVAYRAAVVAEPGDYRLDAGPYPGENRVLPQSLTNGDQVSTLTVAEALDRTGLESVDLMKIDIEGGEKAVFEAAADWAPRVKAILGEVHPPLTREAALDELRSFGFEPLPVPARPVLEDIILARRSGD